MNINEQDSPINNLESPNRVVGEPENPAVVMPANVSAAIHRSGNWFFWIAGLSLINSISALMGGSWHFILGLGITTVVDIVGGEVGGLGKGVAFGFDLIAAALFVIFGLLSRRMMLWVFGAGMVIYVIDGLLCLLVKDFLSAGFHLYALYCIYVGAAVLYRYRKAVGQMAG